ncbi:MAG: hypothetical protein HQK65_03965 [Desulfamplus sp.]|nr:hypothetical protein [Desulfamplus sp.]
MSDSFENIWLSTISDLQKKRKETLREYEDRYNQFIRLDSVLKEKREKLSRLNTEIALIDRKIKENRNKNFLLNKKHTDMQDALTLLKGGIEKKQSILVELKGRKKNLQNRFNELMAAIPDSSKEIETLSHSSRTNKKKLLKLRKEKKVLSDEISRFLSETSIERDEFEKKAKEINEVFITTLTERSAAKGRLAALKKETKEILNSIDMFKTRLDHVGEMKTLKESIPENETEYQSLGTKYAQLQTEVLNKRELLNAITARVKSGQDNIISISDDNLLKMDGALSELNQNKIDFQKLSEQQRGDLDDILKIMVENAALEENQDIIWQRLESLETGLLELARG